MILPVGVVYGTRPQEVIDLMLGIAADHPEVSAYPKPECLFRGSGENALHFELRCFTDGDWIAVLSDLGVAAEDALREAQISIAYPQRDLHLRNVDDLGAAIGEALRAGNGAERNR